MRKFVSSLLWLLAAGSWATVVHAQAPAAPAAAPAGSTSTASQATRITTVEAITEYRLANGLRVLLAPDTSKATTTVNITYLVGNRHENYGETGMAHLLEHLTYKGTPSQGNIMTELGKRGMRSKNLSVSDSSMLLRSNLLRHIPTPVLSNYSRQSKSQSIMG